RLPLQLIALVTVNSQRSHASVLITERTYLQHIVRIFKRGGFLGDQAGDGYSFEIALDIFLILSQPGKACLALIPRHTAVGVFVKHRAEAVLFLLGNCLTVQYRGVFVVSNRLSTRPIAVEDMSAA